MIDYSLPFQIRVKELMHSEGYGIWIFRRHGERLQLLKPFQLEYETFETDGGAVFYGDKPPTLELSRETVHKERVFDSLYEAMVAAGLRQSDKELQGEHRMLKEFMKREREQADRSFALLNDTVRLSLLPPSERRNN